MNAPGKFQTLLNRVMMAVLILVFGGAGLWVLIAPDAYTGTMGITIDKALGRAEIRALGGLYFLAGALGLCAWLWQSRLADAYKIMTYLLGGILIGRIFAFANGNFHPLIIAYAVLELVFIAHTIHRLRSLAA